MLIFKLNILFLFLFIGGNIYSKGEESDQKLEKVERWIRYSLHAKRWHWDIRSSRLQENFEYFVPTEEEEDDNRSKGYPFFNAFVSGKCLESVKFEKVLSERDNFKWKWKVPEQCTKIRCPPWKSVLSNLLNWLDVDFYSPSFMTDEEQYYEQYLRGFFGYESDKVPNWMRTLLKISDLIGWLHFWAFDEFIKLPYIADPEEYLPYYEDIMANKIEPFYTGAGIDLGLISQIMEDKYHLKLNWHIKKAIKWGVWMVGPMLHMVLYRTLSKAIGDIVPLKQLGGMTLAHMSRRDFAIYELVQKHNEQKMLECYEGMPRKDYVVYWLKQMYDALRENYEANRAKFLKYTQLRPKQDPNTQAMLRELAKYVPYWDKILETIDAHGIQGLDSTIDLFGPSDSDESEGNDETSCEKSEQ